MYHHHCSEGGKMTYELFIVASALQNPDNPLEIRVGLRHNIILNSASPPGSCAQWTQGFLASDGKFYSREHACTIALAAKQIDHVIEPLCSEDLWPYPSSEHLMLEFPTDTEAIADLKVDLQRTEDFVEYRTGVFECLPVLRQAFKIYRESVQQGKV